MFRGGTADLQMIDDEFNVVSAGAAPSTWCFAQRNLWLCLFCESF
jgi:hypothetical protein